MPISILHCRYRAFDHRIVHRDAHPTQPLLTCSMRASNSIVAFCFQQIILNTEQREESCGCFCWTEDGGRWEMGKREEAASHDVGAKHRLLEDDTLVDMLIVLLELTQACMNEQRVVWSYRSFKCCACSWHYISATAITAVLSCTYWYTSSCVLSSGNAGIRHCGE